MWKRSVSEYVKNSFKNNSLNLFQEFTHHTLHYTLHFISSAFFLAILVFIKLLKLTYGNLINLGLLFMKQSQYRLVTKLKF